MGDGQLHEGAGVPELRWAVGGTTDVLCAVVRCRNCEFYRKVGKYEDGEWYVTCRCSRFGDHVVGPYGFCAWARRREEGE